MAPIHVGQPWQGDPRQLFLRPFDGSPADYEALVTIRNATLRATTLPEDYSDMTAGEVERYYYRADFSMPDNAWLMFHADTPVAAAIVYPTVLFSDRPPGNFDMYVVPGYARHGSGSRLLDHLEQAAAQRGHRVLETTVAKEDAQSARFLTRRGFNVVSHSLHFVRPSLEGITAPTLPQGYEIRSLHDLQEQPELYMETANRLGAYDPNYALIRPEELDRLASGAAWEPEGILFLFAPQSRIVGVIRASGVRAAKGRGYLHEIRVEPSSRGQGLGGAMVSAALRYLAENGVTRAELDTTGENTAAQTLAARSGFTPARHWLHFLKPLVTRNS